MSVMASQDTTNQVQASTKVSRQVFIQKTEDNLRELRNEIDALREKSINVILTDTELENAFNCLYDARDYLKFYEAQLNADPKTDPFLQGEWDWVRNYMSDLVEYGVGDRAEIRRTINYNLKSKNGTDVGQGDEIQVTTASPTRRHRGIIYRNWMNVDRIFWLRDHDMEMSDYERVDTYRRTSSEDSYYDERYD